MIYNNRAGDGVTITPPAFNVSRETMTMSNEQLEKARELATALEGRPGAMDLVEAARLIREMCNRIEYSHEPSY
jgi:hypothetical protein